MKRTYSVLSAVALVATAAVSNNANAAANATVTSGAVTAFCDGGNATRFDQYGGPGTPNTVTANFVKVGFAVQCSANSFVTAIDSSPTTFLVGSASAKGNQSFRGSSNGGAVVTHTKCATTACVVGDSTTAASAASSM